MRIHKISLNSKKFYDNHPDLMPRNLYLYLGRVKSAEQIEDEFNKVFKLSFYKKCQKLFSKIKQKLKEI